MGQKNAVDHESEIPENNNLNNATIESKNKSYNIIILFHY